MRTHCGRVYKYEKRPNKNVPDGGVVTQAELSPTKNQYCSTYHCRWSHNWTN